MNETEVDPPSSFFLSSFHSFCSGQWVTGVDLGTRWEGTFTGQNTVYGSCDTYNDWRGWDDARKEGFKNFALASMDALQN